MIEHTSHAVKTEARSGQSLGAALDNLRAALFTHPKSHSRQPRGNDAPQCATYGQPPLVRDRALDFDRDLSAWKRAGQQLLDRYRR